MLVTDICTWETTIRRFLLGQWGEKECSDTSSTRSSRFGVLTARCCCVPVRSVALPWWNTRAAVGLIAVVAVVAIAALGGGITNLFNTANTCVGGLSGASC